MDFCLIMQTQFILYLMIILDLFSGNNLIEIFFRFFRHKINIYLKRNQILLIHEVLTRIDHPSAFAIVLSQLVH